MSPPSSRRRSLLLGLVLLAAGAGFVTLGVGSLWSGDRVAILPPTAAVPTATPEPTATEPILPPPPTATLPPTHTAVAATAPVLASPVARAEMGALTPTPAPTRRSPTSPPVPRASATQTPAPTATRESPPSPSPSTAASPTPPASQKALYGLQERMGIGGGGVPATQDLAQRLGFGWYLDWSANPSRFRSSEVEYVPMIRLKDGHADPSGEALLAVVDALPGALWLIGNEPDVKWQDDVPPEVYARLYHDLYHLLKTRDPSCQVAIGGVSQPTPLRLRYLDRILEAYRTQYGEPMPVDVWNVHNFILREERDSWGVDIPPGMAENSGQLREIAEHDDLEIFRQQIVDFRRWMKQRGQQDKPLIVTEYGILMPNDYGFPPDRVERFMLASFDFFRTAADPALGYAADGYRLVQRWCWFSLADTRYPTGNLVWPDGGEFTPLGAAFQAYAHSSP